VFAVPGESYLAVLDGLHGAQIETVVCRHEGGAAYMAEAHGKLTGQPGVAMVTRGPGAANAFVAIHAAWQDATPLVLFVGLVPVADRNRESFQEFDPGAWFGTQTKRVFVLDDAARASEVVAEAFFAARSGRPGPVVVGLPEDVLTHHVDGDLHPVIPVGDGAVSVDEVDLITSALREAKRPLMFVGGPRWTAESAALITQFAEDNGIPVLQDWRASDRIPFRSGVNVGWLGYGRTEAAIEMFTEADVLVAIGAVPSDVPTDGFRARQDPHAVNFLVNVDPALNGRSGAVTAHVLSAPLPFAKAMSGVQLGRQADWRDWLRGGRRAQENVTDVDSALNALPATRAHTAHMTVVVAEVLERLPDDAIFTFGAGNHCHWAQTYLPTNVFPSQLSMRNGSMGYSVPAAVAASLEHPDRLVVSVAGDGEFLMNGQEIATAAQHGAAMLVIVMDNGQFGTIRDHQESQYPGRVSGTQLSNPDFAGYARAFGGHGETVTADDQAADAVERAFKAVADNHQTAVIHVITDPAISTP